MTTGDILGIVGAVIAAAGIVATIVYGRLALKPPKRQLIWSYSAAPLFAGDHAIWSKAIQVRVQNQQLDDPYLVTLRVENSGREDVTSETFDQGRALRFRVDGTKVATVYDDPRENDFIAVNGNEIMLGPELLHPGSHWTVRFITKGEPRVRLESAYLAGTDIREGANHKGVSNQTARRSALAAAAATGGSTIAAILIELVAVLVSK